MKTIYHISALLLLSMLWTGCQKSVPQKHQAIKGVNTYETKHFSIAYPITFKARYSKDDGYFTSPDGTVTFYVCGIGKADCPKDYMHMRPSEKELSSDGEKKDVEGAYYDYVQTSHKTYKAKNGSYYRTYTAKRKCNTKGKDFYGNCRSEIFGIRYKNKVAYNRYKNDFIRFKDSFIELPTRR